MAMVSDSSIKQARNTLAAERRRLQDELRRVDQAIEAMDRLLGSGGVTQRRRRSAPVKDAVAQIMRESGRVMHADDVLDVLRSRGVEVSAADPKATVVTALIRLRDAGQVRALGRNKFIWMGEGAIGSSAEEVEEPE